MSVIHLLSSQIIQHTYLSIVGNGKIPEAPKLPSKQALSQKVTKFPKNIISKSSGSKSQNPPQLPAMSAREELMLAIRVKGGVQGLRKVYLKY